MRLRVQLWREGPHVVAVDERATVYAPATRVVRASVRTQRHIPVQHRTPCETPRRRRRQAVCAVLAHIWRPGRNHIRRHVRCVRARTCSVRVRRTTRAAVTITIAVHAAITAVGDGGPVCRRTLLLSATVLALVLALGLSLVGASALRASLGAEVALYIYRIWKSAMFLRL